MIVVDLLGTLQSRNVRSHGRVRRRAQGVGAQLAGHVDDGRRPDGRHAENQVGRRLPIVPRSMLCLWTVQPPVDCPHRKCPCLWNLLPS